MVKTCEICGKPSGFYPLCRDCFKLRDEEKIIQCSKCKKWHNQDTKCDCEEKTTNIHKTCLICGQQTKYTEICSSCNNEIESIKTDLLKDLKGYNQTIEYYSNLKNSIFWINKMEYATQACKKLYALAKIADYYKSGKQKITAIKDIEYLLTKKKEFLEKKETKKLKDTFEKEINNTLETTPDTTENVENTNNEIADYRKVYPAVIHCDDGHYVRSNNEKVIDNTLYKYRIFHEYEKRYKAKDGNTYYPDYYLPDAKVFIEYFGVESNKDKNEAKRKIFEEDKKHKWEFIYSESQGILDEVIEDIIDKYNLIPGSNIPPQKS